ncbi:hypothetical protein HpBTM60_04560 [Helicobacter pylori]
MKAREMIDELLEIIEATGNVDITTKNGEDFEFDYYNRGSEYSGVSK